MSRIDIVIDRGRPAFEAIRGRLEEFCKRTASRHQHIQTPEWVGYELTMNQREPVIVRAMYGDDIAGYAILFEQRSPIAYPIRGRQITLFDRPLYRLMGTVPVLSQQVDEDVTRAIAQAVSGQLLAERPVLLEEVEEPSEFLRLLREAAGRGCAVCATGPLPQRIWKVENPVDFKSYDAQFTSARRYKFKSRKRKLAAHLGGDLAIIEVRRPEQVAEYLRLVSDLYPKTWHHASQPKDWLATHWIATCKGLAARGWLRCFVMTSNGRAIAFFQAYQYMGRFETEEMGYDPAFESFGSGTLLLYEAMKQILTVDVPQVYSLGYGDNPYKETIARTSVPAMSYLLATRLSDKAQLARLALANSAYRAWRKARARRNGNTSSAGHAAPNEQQT